MVALVRGGAPKRASAWAGRGRVRRDCGRRGIICPRSRSPRGLLTSQRVPVKGGVMTVTGIRAVAVAQGRELSARAYIDAHRHRRHSNRVLHGHPSPLFWKNRDISVPEVMVARAEALRHTPKRLNLYVPTPYCLH